MQDFRSLHDATASETFVSPPMAYNCAYSESPVMARLSAGAGSNRMQHCILRPQMFLFQHFSADQDCEELLCSTTDKTKAPFSVT